MALGCYEMVTDTAGDFSVVLWPRPAKHGSEVKQNELQAQGGIAPSPPERSR